MIKYIFGFVFITISSILYDKYKQKQEKIQEGKTYDLVSKYLINDVPIDSQNIIWVHVDQDVNARKWLHWGSRNTKSLNQPYLNLTLKSIIQQANGEFKVCIIDDDSFQKLIPGFSLDLRNVPEHAKTPIRTLAKLKLLHLYGGFIVPISYLALQPLSNLFYKGLESNNCFVCCSQQHTLNCMNESVDVDISFMGARKNTKIISDIIEDLEILYSNDFTNEKTILNKVNSILKHYATSNTLTIIDAKNTGCTDAENKTISLDMLFSEQSIKFSNDLNGILIPYKNILKRNKYNWFSVLPEEEIIILKNNLGRYFSTSIIT